MFKKSSPAPVTDQMESTEELTNQTYFSEEEPLFEEPPALYAPPSAAPLPPKKKIPLFPIVLICLSVVLIVSGLAMMSVKQVLSKKPSTQTEKTPGSTQEEDAVRKRLAETESDLHNADPIKLELPFPPVERNLYLDQPAR
jgi:hypothetical protein